MARITSKYRLTIPKALAERIGVAPGDEVECRVVGDSLLVTPARARKPLSLEQRLEMFDAATRRQATRNKGRRTEGQSSRGWSWEELYDRGRTR